MDSKNQEIKPNHKKRFNPMKNRLRKKIPKIHLHNFNNITDINSTCISDEEHKILQIILEKIKKHEKSANFRQPAIRCFQNQNDKEYYKSIIKNPEDLGHITKKLNSNKYKHIQQFYDDLTRIWKNAQIFNPKNSMNYRDSLYMSKYVDKLFQDKKLYDKLIIQKDNNNSSNNKMTLKKRQRENYNDESKDKEKDLNINNNIFKENKINEDINKANNNNLNLYEEEKEDKFNDFHQNNNNQALEKVKNINYENEINNNIMPNINNSNSSINLIFQKELINKKKFKSYEDKIIFLRTLIAKQLDKLSDENMFGLIEYIEQIRPEAVIEVPDNKINIDMNLFIEDTYSKLIDYFRDLMINKIK